MTEQYVTSGTAKIWTHINDNNAKPYLLMCGAGPGVNDGLSEVDTLINDRFNTIRFNHRGCGTSTADGNYKIETVLEDIETIRRYYGVENWFILGHSWGANIALFYALKHPQVCKKVIYLCGIGVQNDSDWAEECAKNTDEFEQGDFKTDDMNYEVLDAEIKSFNKYIQQPTILRDIAKLQIPFYVILGAKDPRPSWATIQLAHLLPMAELKILGECGHFPWLTHPDLLKEIILERLK